jgi:hypothetical protein
MTRSLDHCSLDDLAPGARVVFASRLRLSKGEAFAACQALADADRVLVRDGHLDEAKALGDLFTLLESRLTEPTSIGPDATDGPVRPRRGRTRATVS